MAEPFQGTATSVRIIPQSAKDVAGADGSVISATSPAFKPNAKNFVDDALTGRPQPGEPVRGKQDASGDCSYTANRSSLIPMAKAHFGGYRVRGATGFKVHEFWYDTMTLQALEVKFTNDVGSLYQQMMNCLIGMMSWDLAFEDIMKGKFSFAGTHQIDPMPTTSLVTGTLTDRTGPPALQYLRAFVAVNGTKVATMQSFSIASDRKPAPYMAMDETARAAGVFTVKPTLSGNAKLLFNDATYTNNSFDPDNVQSIVATVPQGNFFGAQFELPSVRFQLPQIGTNGLALHDQTLAFDGWGPTGGGADVSAQLRSKFFTTPADLTGLTLIFTVTGAGAQTITFAGTETTPALVASKINATATLLLASVERKFGETGGSVVLKTIAKGSGVTLTIGAGTANTALGFTDTTATPGIDGVALVLRVFSDVAA